MVISARPVLVAAREAVQEIGEPYDGYHVDLDQHVDEGPSDTAFRT